MVETKNIEKTSNLKARVIISLVIIIGLVYLLLGGFHVTGTVPIP